MIKKNKRAVSIMVAYVLLIIIAITLSIFVFTWLKKYVPKEKGECESDVSLVLDKYCFFTESGDERVKINVRNKGLFNVGGFFIRISNDSGLSIHSLNETISSDTYRVADGRIYQILKPGEVYENNFSYTHYNQITNIEIEPFMVKNNETILCDNAVVNTNTENINCE